MATDEGKLPGLSLLDPAEAEADDLLMVSRPGVRSYRVRWADLPGAAYPEIAGEVGVVDITKPYGHVERYGAVGDNATDCATAIANAIASVPYTRAEVVLGARTYRVDSTIQVDHESVVVRGAGRERGGINFRGTGPLFQLDTDDGNTLGWGGYDGTGFDFAIEDLRLSAVEAADTALANTLGSYKTGTYGLRDWRGGGIRMSRCILRGFQYGFWGVESDFNYFENVHAENNQTAFWLGPRSDQNDFNNISTLENDTAFSFNGVHQALVSHWASNLDGSASTYPVSIHAYPVTGVWGTHRPCRDIVFDTPMLENAATSAANPGFDIPAFFDLAVADTVQSGGIVIRAPVVFVYDYSDATKRHVLFLADVGNVGFVDVEQMSGGYASSSSYGPWTNLRAVFRYPADPALAVAARFRFSEMDDAAHVSLGGRLVENYLTPAVIGICHVSGNNKVYRKNVVGGTGSVAIGHVGLFRSLQHDSAAPASGLTRQSGDVVLRSDYAQGKDFGYVWDSALAVPVPLVVPTVSSDRGNADVTLTAGTSNTEVRFATALTANRTVTLSTTGALNGHKFRITREATATGAFNLDVGGLKTLTAAGQWCEVMFNGSAWVLRAAGSL